MEVVATGSRGVLAIPHLAAMLGVGEVVHLLRRPLAEVDAIVGWGRKSNTLLAAWFAGARSIPFIRLEDGFIRSLGLGVQGAPPMSIVIDPVGMYYDSTRPSRLENLLAGRDPESHLLANPAMWSRATKLIDRLRETGVSKYNGGSDRTGLAPSNRRRVLVVDQTDRDLSLRLGGAMDGGLRLLTSVALEEHPDAEIIVKIHPDVLSGEREGHEREIPNDPRVTVISRWVQPAALLREVEDVYVMTSQVGFDALLHGHKVHCFGKPFYAGWGLTNDRVEVQRRGVSRTLEELVVAALILYPRYVDVATGKPCEVEQVVEHIAELRAAKAALKTAGMAELGSGVRRSPVARARFVANRANSQGRSEAPMPIRRQLSR